MRPNCRSSSWLDHVCHSLMILTVTSLPLLKHLRSHDPSPAPSHHLYVEAQYVLSIVAARSRLSVTRSSCSILRAVFVHHRRLRPLCRRLHVILAKRCLGICRRCHENSMPPHANPVVSYPCIPSSRCIFIIHRLHYHGRIFYFTSHHSRSYPNTSLYVAIRYGCKVFYSSGVYFGDMFLRVLLLFVFFGEL